MYGSAYIIGKKYTFKFFIYQNVSYYIIIFSNKNISAVLSHLSLYYIAYFNLYLAMNCFVYNETRYYCLLLLRSWSLISNHQQVFSLLIAVQKLLFRV